MYMALKTAEHKDRNGTNVLLNWTLGWHWLVSVLIIICIVDRVKYRSGTPIKSGQDPWHPLNRLWRWHWRRRRKLPWTEIRMITTITFEEKNNSMKWGMPQLKKNTIRPPFKTNLIESSPYFFLSLSLFTIENRRVVGM